MVGFSVRVLVQRTLSIEVDDDNIQQKHPRAPTPAYSCRSLLFVITFCSISLKDMAPRGAQHTVVLLADMGSEELLGLASSAGSKYAIRQPLSGSSKMKTVLVRVSQA